MSRHTPPTLIMWVYWVPQVAVLRDLCHCWSKTQVSEYRDLWHPAHVFR